MGKGARILEKARAPGAAGTIGAAPESIMLDTFFDRFTRAIELVLAAAFIAAVLLNFSNVIGRYVFGVTLGWADEAQIFIMVWMAFLGAVVATWRGIHLRMDMLFKIFARPVQLALQVAELLVLIVACSFVVFHSYSYALTMFRLDRVSDVGRIPMWIPHGGVALGFALIAVISLVHLADVARGRLPRHERGSGAQ
jgi:TRAP-type transport system small permease protein